MKKELLFENGFLGVSIRVVEDEDDFWFVAKDLSDFLGYEQTNNLTKLLEEDEIRSSKMNIAELPNLINNSMGTIYINESGLYNAIFNSTKPEAKQFKKCSWLN